VRKIVATTRRALIGIGFMLVALLVFSAPALAVKERPFTGVSFGPAGTGGGSFSNVQGVTVDQTTGDVFVYDDGEGGRIYKFDAAGEPVDFSGLGTNVITGVGGAGGAEEEIAVDSSNGPAAGDIYAANNNVVQIYSAAGSPLGTLSGGEMCGVAVDAAGAVYVGVYSEGAVRKYVPTANPATNASEVSSIRGPGGICNVAADSEGNVYAAIWGGGVNRYEALQFGSPVATGTLIDGSGKTLAVDRSTNALYVNQGNAIAEYDASDNLIGTSGSGRISGSFGVGVDSAKNELYVPSEGRVMVFGPSVLLPTVSSGEASEITSSSATISGSVNPEGTATTYQFQYGTTTSYGSVSPVSPQSVGSDSTTHELNAQLTDLSPGTEYHYRLLASGTNGTSYGSDGTFKTSGPPNVISEFASSGTQSSVVVGAFIEPNKLDTHYQVEYGTSESYGAITSPVDMGTSAGEVTKELAGLRVGTTYHYRFVATNAEGTVHGSDQTVSTMPVARIESEAMSDASSTEVTMKARVEAFGAESTFYFEYGPTSAYGAATPEEALSSEAQATLMGLPAETAYHFRLVIENQFGTVDGEDMTFATAPTPSLTLPDGRRYEKVSPNNNADGNVIPPPPIQLIASEGSFTRLPFMAAANGSAFAYIGQPSEAGGTGAGGLGGGNQYLSRRSSSGGWTAENIEPASGELNTSPAYQAFTKDLTAGFLTYNGLDPLVPGAPGERYPVLYKHTLSTGAFEPIFNVKPPNRGPEEFTAVEVYSYGGGPYRPVYAGSSSDLGHVLFMANDVLAPGAVDGGAGENNLYDSHDGLVTLVNVLPDGSTEPNATFGGPRLPYVPADWDAPSFSHDISENGQRIFWTDLNNHNLYLREGGGRTVQVDASAGGGGTFWTATPDGSKVLFTKSGDVYEYNVENGQTTDLTPGGAVQGIVGTSEDLSYIYFVADAALASGAEAQECLTPSESERHSSCNLYVLHQGDPVRFIAKLAENDNFSYVQSFTGRMEGDWQSGMGNREAEVTPDGRNLVFTSSRSLTGYENGPPEVGARGAEEVFTYNYGSARLLCASCNPTGEPPVHDHVGSALYSAFLPVSNMNTYTLRWMSSDGTKVFFDSVDALVPQDTNGVVDVYEWEEDGAGSCRRSQGCIYLLSSGSSPESSWLLDASEDGDDVFIVTRSQLTLEDQNETLDVYDVRANAPIPPTQPQCTGTGCQGVASSPPVFATPSSVTYNGVGNFPVPVKAASKAKKPKPKPKAKRKRRKKSKGSPHHKAKKSARKSVKSHGRSK
jgi:hypothetical protein